MKAQITRIHRTYMVLATMFDDEDGGDMLLAACVVTCCMAAMVILVAIAIVRQHFTGQ
jgi:hypothetical protein